MIFCYDLIFLLNLIKNINIKDKSISVIEALIQGKSRGLEEEDEMSYKPSDLALMKQYSESHVEPVLVAEIFTLGLI